jgi:Uma2 family endonuclease
MGEPKITHRYTVEEYLAMEEVAEYRSEYFEGEIFAMAGGSPSHDRIASQCDRVIGSAIESKGCETFTSSMKVRIENSKAYYYPDLSVACGEAEFDENGIGALTNPVLIIEVLSKSTEGFDRGDKFQRYKQISSFREYVMIAQSKPQIDVFYKTDAGFWRIDNYEGLDAVMELRSLGIQVKLADIYKRVKFEKESTTSTTK